jgi:hypothetical protein
MSDTFKHEVDRFISDCEMAAGVKTASKITALITIFKRPGDQFSSDQISVEYSSVNGKDFHEKFYFDKSIFDEKSVNDLAVSSRMREIVSSKLKAIVDLPQADETLKSKSVNP